MTTTKPAAGERSSTRTELSRRAGIVAGPLFLLVSAIQLPFNEGFDLTRHPFSALSIGALGWLQIANFVVVGCLYALSALAFAAAFGRGKAARIAFVLPLLLGAGKVVAGLFVSDPAYGFPEGTPEGAPTTLSASASMHGLGFMVALAAWISLLGLMSWNLSRRGERGWALASAATAVLLVLVPPLLMGWEAGGTVFLYVVLPTAYVFMSVLLRHLGNAAAPR